MADDGKKKEWRKWERKGVFGGGSSGGSPELGDGQPWKVRGEDGLVL